MTSMISAAQGWLSSLLRGVPGFRRQPAAAWLALTLAASLLMPPNQAAPPSVSRIEPPNWWPQHTRNPVRLLVSGARFAGARVEAPGAFAVRNLRINAAGTCLMVDLNIPANARPGRVPLRLVTAEGAVEVPFALRKPLAARGRFAGFSTDDVIYLLMPDRFANGDPANDNPSVSPGLFDRAKPRHYHGGDLQGVADRLPYLRDLGVTALWLTPWYDNVNHLNHLEKYTRDNRRAPEGDPVTDYHGYGAVDFYAVEEHFGDVKLLRRLADRAHRAGLKLIQDQVANHTGPYHPWTTNPPTPTWYNGTVANHLENTWQTWTVAEPQPPADKLRATLDGWFIDLLPDLNQDDPETAAYLIQNSLWWLGMTGLDAIRQDTLPYVPRAYWSRWTSALKRQYPRLTVLGEMWDGNPKLVSFFQGGQARFDGIDSGVDTLFDFPLHYAIRDVFAKGQPMTRLFATLAADTNYVNARVLVTFLGLHDTPRFLNEDGATIEGLKLAFTFLLTARGTPLIYYGDEIALRGGGDPDNRRDFPGGWVEDPRSAFSKSGRTAEQESVHAHVRSLATLHRALAPLRRGALVTLRADEGTCAFARVTPEQTVIVAFNNAPEPRSFSLDLAVAKLARGRIWRDRLGSLGRLNLQYGTASFRLPARSSTVLVPEP